MRSVWTILFLLVSIGAAAQSYVPMLSDSTVWKVSHQFEGCYTNTTFISGDTSIGGYTYQNLKGNNTPFGNEGTVLWLREDTTARKVYARKRPPAWSNDTAEFLLYDFSLQPGDSILLFNAWYNGSWYLYGLDTIGWFYLDSIGLSNTTAGVRSSFHFTKAEFTTTVWLNNMQWIEGIGVVHGYYLLGYAETLAADWLDCAYSGSVQLYDGSEYGGPPDGFCFCDWDNVTTISYDTDLVVYPVPADQKIFARNDNVNEKSMAVLSDLTGRMLISQPSVSTVEFNVSTLSPGVYLLNIYPHRKTVKVIVSR